MADFFRCRLGVVQRSQCQSAVERSAYQSCTRMEAPDGTVFDYTENRVSHGHIKTIICAPAGSPEWVYDRDALWRNAVLAERRVNAQEARVIEVSLPRQMPPPLWEGCTSYLCASFVELGMAAQVDIHCIPASDGLPNGHLHMELTMRCIEPAGFSRRKPREWNSMFFGKAKNVRTEIAARLNAFCKANKIKYHADPRRNEERGLSEPEATLPRWNWLVEKRTGVKTVWMRGHDEHREAKREIADLERQLQDVQQAIEREQDKRVAVAQQEAVERAAYIRRRARLVLTQQPQSAANRRRHNIPQARAEAPALSQEYIGMPP